MENSLQTRLASTAFAFRGYNVTNMGRSAELLKHRAYGPIVENFLDEASKICEAATDRKTNLVNRVRRKVESTLRSYPQDLAMIIGIEMAQLNILEELFDVSIKDAQMAFGYSLGEIGAVIAGGIYSMEAALTPLLKLAKDSASLADNIEMGILFSRGPALDLEAILKLCLEISSKGDGVIDISSYLSPNTVLLLGQGNSVDEFKKSMHDVLPSPVHLRKNSNHWPPLHTTIIRQKNIPNRASVMLDTAPGGFTPPTPPILSMVTGDYDYNEYNSRELLQQWVDHPQRAWDVVDTSLRDGVDVVIHIGPEPNILPATFNRLSIDVTTQLNKSSLASLGLRAVSRIVRRSRPWLSSLLTSDATLLRAPFVEQIVLEDWLLENEIP